MAEIKNRPGMQKSCGVETESALILLCGETIMLDEMLWYVMSSDRQHYI